MLNIYINTWGNYNEHSAYNGKWITLPMDENELTEILETAAIAMNDNDPAWFVNDYEWEGESFFDVGEMDDYYELNELCETISDFDEYDKEKLLAIINATGKNIKEAIDNLDDYTFYQNMTLIEVAYKLMEECYDLPEIAQTYFDYEAFARDLGCDGYYETEYGVISR